MRLRKRDFCRSSRAEARHCGRNKLRRYGIPRAHSATPVERALVASSLTVYNPRMRRDTGSLQLFLSLVVCLPGLTGWPASGLAQTNRLVKVLLQSQQLSNQNEDRLQGSGSVIIRRGTVYPSGRVTANETKTT